ncbi:hypothetical protein TNCV_3201021 [Trichonephila clavipes]|nr:hypothetical protein TNCV_3201021 [Trichonephila clavipes]
MRKRCSLISHLPYGPLILDALRIFNFKLIGTRTRGESGQQFWLSPGASGSDPQWPGFPMTLHGSTFVNVCGYNAFCSSEGQEDFRLGRFGSLLSFLVNCLIAGDPKMTWDPLADWKYTRIYNPQRRLRVLVEKCRKDSSQFLPIFF